MRMKETKFLLLICCLFFTLAAVSQERTIRGVVADDKGVPIPGVNVEVKGSDQGVFTDFEGEFEIEVQEADAVLVFSYLGYITQEKKADTDDMRIQLKESTSDLDEVVVVGYGTQRKRDIVGAVSEKKITDITTRPAADIRSSLQGAIPGLTIQHSAGGDPSKNPTMNIRGFNSINGGSPLVLVDGVEESISYINPADIESVTVLKDAEAAAIYGARGAFGVVLVNTKKGRSGDIKIEYENNFGWSQNTARTDFISDPYLYGRTIDAAIGGSTGGNYTGYDDEDWDIIKGVADGEIQPYHKLQPDGTYKFYYDTDYYDYMFKKTRPMEMHNVTVSGGTDKLKAYFSGRVYEREKVQKIQDARMNRYNYRLNVSFKPYEWLEVSADSRFSTRVDQEYGGTKNGWGDVYGVSRWRDQFPFFPAEIGGTAVDVGRTGGGYVARIGALMSGNSWRKWRYENFSNTVRGKMTPVEGLELNFDYTNRIKRTDRTFRYAPFEFLNGNKLTLQTGGLDRSGEWRWKDRYQALNFYGSYGIKVADRHNFKLMLGYNEEVFDRDRVAAQMEDFSVRDKHKLDLATEMYNIEGSSQDWGVQGYFGRFNYDFDDKYLLEINARYDGSSRFPSGDQWGFFPSGAVAWRIDGEEFWSSFKDVIPTLKLRASYGRLGNQTVGVSTFRQLLGLGKTTWLDTQGDKLHYARVPSPLPETIGWEKVTTKNIGLDFGIISNKLTGSFELYERNTTDMYLPGEPLPAVFGASEPRRSYASLQNKGFELELAYNNSFTVGDSPLNLSVTANVSNSKAYITKFDNPNGVLSTYWEGQRLGDIWGYRTDGQFQSDEEAAAYQSQFVDPANDLGKVYSSIFNHTTNKEWDKLRAGDIKYVDLDGDGKIDNGDNTLENPGDREPIGNALPKFPFGFSVNAEWKGFSVSVTGQGVARQDWYPTGPLYWGTYHRPYASFIRKDLVANAWTEDNPGKYPQIERGYQALNSGRSLYNANDHYLTNIGYLRIKNLTVGYQIPSEITKKVFLERVRVYASAENVFTWSFGNLTKYLDPEEMGAAIDFNNPSGANARSNADEGLYPMEKTYSVGIQLTL